MRAFWRIEPDPVEAEYIRTPLNEIDHFNEFHEYVGDCDDAATFAGSILAALSYPCKFLAIRLAQDQDFSHVFLRCLVNGQPFDIDPIVPLESMPLPLHTMEVMGVDVL